MSSYHYLPPVLGGFGLAAAFIIYIMVKKYPGGEGKIAAIAESIHLGAMVFIRREYSMLAIFVAVVSVILANSLGLDTMSAFLTGAVVTTTFMRSPLREVTTSSCVRVSPSSNVCLTIQG